MTQQRDLLSDLHDLDFVRLLLAEMHDDLLGRVSRFRQLDDTVSAVGSRQSMIPGGEVAYAAWVEARSSFVHGNFVATVLLSQAFAEQVLAAMLIMGLDAEPIPAKIKFPVTLKRCIARGMISQQDADDLRRLMNLRNPLSHHRLIDDPTNLSRRAIDACIPGEEHLRRDATFAISMVVRLLALPMIRLGV
ncbi:hypothetical protein [Sphingomonas sp. CROZ-RG-20F-R02-07]|uniref:hypothetical protein n=1 Tax=Sphingomonas sp. CROZ-RG-20F-R02-07 TaxID=2914832 RepID=UPI001F574B65|nr:hypothetical protein [Sphingomonas sp. CROZ-RG-20F-R02-07]